MSLKHKSTMKGTVDAINDAALDDGMTPKQSKFLRLYFELGNASAAYRKAYDAKNMTAKTVNEQASRLLAHRKVAARVAACRQRAADECSIEPGC